MESLDAKHGSEAASSICSVHGKLGEATIGLDICMNCKADESLQSAQDQTPGMDQKRPRLRWT